MLTFITPVHLTKNLAGITAMLSLHNLDRTLAGILVPQHGKLSAHVARTDRVMARTDSVAFEKSLEDPGISEK